MRPRSLEQFTPLCPVCLARDGSAHPVRLSAAWREEGDDVLEGALLCDRTDCGMEYPVVEGIPILVADLRSYVATNITHLLEGGVSPALESILGDCCGPASPFDVARQHLSIYGHGHYGDLAPGADPGDGAAGAPARVLSRGFDLLEGELPGGPVLDVGCSLGRGTFEAARRTGRAALGIDRNFSMLRVARGVLRDGVARYPLRRVGLVYDRMEIPAPMEGRDRVEFWAADATALPFPAGSFALATSLSVLDCTATPRDHLAGLARVLRDGGAAILATPYDWSPGATPLEAWVGGHSQRGPAGGRSEPVLRALLTPGAHPASVPGLRLAAETEGVPWELRLHDRSRMRYDVHVVAALASG